MRKFLDGTIVTGALGFIAILALAAVFDHSIIWLHAFQALMYVAVIALVLARNRLGYFLGLSIAGFWNYLNLFVTNFFVSGLNELKALIATGKLSKPDQLIAVAAVTFHVLMIAGCLILMIRTWRKTGPDLLRLVATFVASTAYFVAIVALLQPRYLSLFPRALHPHAPF
jgi:hypothetical protein